MHAPSWGASWFLSRPEGRVAAPHPPGKGRYAPGENNDNKSKQLLWGAWGGRISLFVCFMPQQRRGGRIRPGSRRTCRGKAPPSCCARPFGRLKAPLGLSLLRCARKRELSLDVLGKGQAILPRIFQQELAELLLRNRRFQIILAPLGVGAVEIGGAFLGVGLEADIRTGLHELGQVVAVRHGCFEVLDGALADGYSPKIDKKQKYFKIWNN